MRSVVWLVLARGAAGCAASSLQLQQLHLRALDLITIIVCMFFGALLVAFSCCRPKKKKRENKPKAHYNMPKPLLSKSKIGEMHMSNWEQGETRPKKKEKEKKGGLISKLFGTKAEPEPDEEIGIGTKDLFQNDVPPTCAPQTKCEQTRAATAFDATQFSVMKEVPGPNQEQPIDNMEKTMQNFTEEPEEQGRRQPDHKPDQKPDPRSVSVPAHHRAGKSQRPRDGAASRMDSNYRSQRQEEPALDFVTAGIAEADLASMSEIEQPAKGTRAATKTHRKSMYH